MSDTTEGGNELDEWAEMIRELADVVSDTSDWMVIIPTEDYQAVKDRLDTSRNVGIYYRGLSLCYAERDIDEPRVRYKATLSDCLRSLDTDTE